MAIVFLGLGSNLGDRQKNIESAIELIEKKIGNILKTANLYNTEPWGFEAENFFLNTVVKIQTNLSPFEVLEKIQYIEKNLGRKKNNPYVYESRPIDIDILFYENLILVTDKLKIPHPLIHKRLFVLIPLAEIEPNFIHPLFNKSIKTLLSECNDKTEVEIYEKIF